jgi:hypothetical protein
MQLWNSFDAVGLKRALKKYLNHPSIFLFLSMLRVRLRSMRLTCIDPQHLALIHETRYLFLNMEFIKRRGQLK